MKTRLLYMLFVCVFSIANNFAANRFWVGGATGTWEATTSWSETSGGASGASMPTVADDVFFENIAPAVTNADTIAVNSITFTNSNAVFTGGFLISAVNMTVDNSQVSFKNNVEIVSALTFTGTTTIPRITHSGLSSSAIYKFQLGTGGAFALTGNTKDNYFDTTGNSSFRYNTTSALTIFFKPTTTSSLAGINVYNGLITLGNTVAAVRLNFPAANLNNQELILGQGVTFTLNSGGSSGFTELANGGTLNASASGSKFVIKSSSSTTSVLDGTKRIFKTGVVINNLEFNSVGSTFNLFEPIRVRTLTLTNGTINNSVHSITLESGGGVITGAGNTTVAVVALPPTTRYWVGGLAGNWSNPVNWGTASGSTTTPGIPGFGDTVIFDGTAGNESPTVTLTDNVVAESVSFTNSSVIFAGNYAVTTNNMTVTNCQPTFVNALTINTALTLNGTLARISHLPAGTSIYKFTLGNGNAFTLTGNTAENYFEGNAYTNFTYNSETAQMVYFKNDQYLGVINIEKGLLTIGNNISTVRINFNSAKLNNQELILAENVKFTIAPGGSSMLTELANGGVLNASAKGSKVVIASIAPSILKSGVKRLFKSDTTIEHLEMNSIDSTFVLGYPISVKFLSLTEGTIDNSTHNITIATGGKITKVNGNATSPIAAGLPGMPTNVIATAGNAKASVAFTIPEGDGGLDILDYTVVASPGGLTATGTESPIEITGLTNGVAYTFKVFAQNGLGEGDESQVSNQVTPQLNSAIKSVSQTNAPIFNLNNGIVTVKYQSDAFGKATFKLTNINGQEIMNKSIQSISGNNTLSIAVGNLQAGIYIVSLSDGVNTLTDKIIKQ